MYKPCINISSTLLAACKSLKWNLLQKNSSARWRILWQGEISCGMYTYKHAHACLCTNVHILFAMYTPACVCVLAAMMFGQERACGVGTVARLQTDQVSKLGCCFGRCALMPFHEQKVNHFPGIQVLSKKCIFCRQLNVLVRSVSRSSLHDCARYTVLVCLAFSVTTWVCISALRVVNYNVTAQAGALRLPFYAAHLDSTKRAFFVRVSDGGIRGSAWSMITLQYLAADRK